MLRYFAALAFASFPLASLALAQPQADSPPGARVLLRAPAIDSALITGRIMRFDRDTLQLALGNGGAELAIPTSLILLLDESNGRNRWRWARRGASLGFLATGLALAQLLKDEDPSGLASLAGFLVGGFVGGLAGGGVGYAYAPEIWRRRFTEHDPQPIVAAHRIVLPAGAHIRYAETGSRRREADVASFTTDTLALDRGGVIPLSRLASLEIRGNKDRRRGMRYSAAIITGITALGAIPDRAKGVISTGDMLGIMAGNAVIGGAIGAALAPTGWVRVPLP